MDTETLRILANMGFPAVVAGFLLLKMNGKLEKLTESIIKLTDKIENLLERHQ